MKDTMFETICSVYFPCLDIIFSHKHIFITPLSIYGNRYLRVLGIKKPVINQLEITFYNW